MDRNLDDIYFRVEREGRWESVCFSDLTDDQMDSVLDRRSPEWLRSMCKALGHRFREMGDELDIVYGGAE